MRILITGAAGYLGSKLTAAFLSQRDVKVMAVDNFCYSQGHLTHEIFNHENCTLHRVDVVKDRIVEELVPYADVIIPLAAIVGAPACDKNHDLAWRTNFAAIQKIVMHMSPDQHIIYPNTNSGYGTTPPGTICDESTPLKAISVYGETKNAAEEVVLNHPSSTVFRLATVFGTSYRMRLDLLVNTLVYDAYWTNKISIFEGNFRRNFIHINDIVKLFVKICRLGPQYDACFGRKRVFNLGHDGINTTKMDLAKLIASKFYLKVDINTLEKEDPDKRDYNVSSEHARKILSFNPQYDLEMGIYELRKFCDTLSAEQEIRSKQIRHMRNVDHH